MDIPYVHNEDMVETARIDDISFYIINFEQAEDRERLFIRKLIKLNQKMDGEI